MTIPELFEHLEQQPAEPGSAGTLERRLPTQSPCDLFVGVHQPGSTRCLRVRFLSDAAPEPPPPASFRSLELRHSVELVSGKWYRTVLVSALNPAFNSVFTSLVEDVARHISELLEENLAASAFISRLLQWQRLLERGGAEGLSPDEQCGLFGELWYLREKVLPACPVASAVTAWTGSERTAKDFQFPAGAVEVKTTAQKQHQHLSIASEKQLDDRGLNALFLFHLSVERAQGAGETLPQLVAALRGIVAASPASTAFEDGLLTAGYLDAHEDRYAGVGYLIRESSVYRVQAGFPRITEGDLRPGVGDVRYSISATECRHFAAEEEFRSFLQGTSDGH